MRILLAIALAAASAPVAAATSSSNLETIALKLEQSGPSSTLNSQLLSLLKEPAKTIEGRTLPSTAAQYTTNVETAWKLRPTGWFVQLWQQPNLPSPGLDNNCTAMMQLWTPTGLRMETYAWGKGNCAAVSSAAIARAWAYLLKQRGR